MKDDRVLLSHMRDAVLRVLSYTAEGRDFSLVDTRTQDAVIRTIEIVGEASKNVTQALKDTRPDIPWKQIAGMRDTLIHRYLELSSNWSGRSWIGNVPTSFKR